MLFGPTLPQMSVRPHSSEQEEDDRQQPQLPQQPLLQSAVLSRQSPQQQQQQQRQEQPSQPQAQAQPPPQESPKQERKQQQPQQQKEQSQPQRPQQVQSPLQPQQPQQPAQPQPPQEQQRPQSQPLPEQQQADSKNESQPTQPPKTLVSGREWTAIDSAPAARKTESENIAPRLSRMNSKRTLAILKEDSIFTKLAISTAFQNTTVGVIVLNALWIGVDTEWNHSSMEDEDGNLPLHPVSTIIENLFCVYFTGEVVIRFCAYRRKWSCLGDGWFVFDSFLVFCMVLETWILKLVEVLAGGGGSASFLSNFSALRLLRLLRLTRMARLMRAVPELLTLVKGIGKAMKAVSYVLLFLVLILYVFAILFTSQLTDAERTPEDGEPPEDYVLAGDLFASIGDSMMTLLTRGVLADNLMETVDAIKAESLFLQWMFFAFFGLTFALLLNMLIGILCEVVTDSAREEDSQRSITQFSDAVRDAFEVIDVSGDGKVQKKEWQLITDNKEVQESMLELGMDEDTMDEQLSQMEVLLFDTDPIADETAAAGHTAEERAQLNQIASEGYTVEKLIEQLVEFRPDIDAGALDFTMMKTQVETDMNRFQQSLTDISSVLKQVLGPYYVPSSASGLRKSAGERSDLPHWGPGDGVLRPGSAPANMTSQPGGLKDVPTDLLFAALEKRKPPVPAAMRHALPSSPTDMSPN